MKSELGSVVVRTTQLGSRPSGLDLAGQGGSQRRAPKHLDSIMVGLGVAVFLVVIWLVFVHRMYLDAATNAEAAVDGASGAAGGAAGGMQQQAAAAGALRVMRR